MTTPKFFRYPYLAEATGKKKKQVQEYLADHDYIVAPVTIDSKDFYFNKLIFSIPSKFREKGIETLKTRYLKYVWKQTLIAESIAKSKNTANKQILLIHANLLNSHCLNDLIAMYENNDYHFISLEEAMNR